MIKTTYEFISPEKARQYLETNTNNRNLNAQHVRVLANEILEGRWQVTHQGIAFSESGELIDGQHRLNAVIAANRAVGMMVSRDVPSNANDMYMIDMGRKRSVSDVLQMAGYNGMLTSKSMIATLNALFSVKGGRKTKLTPDEIMQYMQENPEICKVLYSLTNIRSGRQSTKAGGANLYAACFAAYLAGEREMAIRSFIRCYFMNEIDPEYNAKAALDLGDYLSRYKLTGSEHVIRAESAIYNYIHNNKRGSANIERYKAKTVWFYPVKHGLRKEK